MSNYKNYLLSQMGIKESQVNPSTVDRNAFEGIDPDELRMGADDEAGEHNMSPEKAKQTAMQHLEEPGQKHYYTGMDMAKKIGMLKDDFMGGGAISPTAIPTPIIALGVRGSSTGGFPSGMDQTGIQPNTPTGRLGGYEPIPTAKDNSELINKTPCNPQINSATPKTEVPQTVVEPHPHQVQHVTGEPPQAATGASTDGDDTLTLKSAMPKGVNIDVSQEGTEEKQQDMNDMDGEESMEDQDEMKQDINEGKHKKGCQCGFCKNKGSFGKKKKTEEKKDTDECMDEEKKDLKESELHSVKEPNFAYCTGCGKKMPTNHPSSDSKQHKVCDKCKGFKEPRYPEKVDETFKRHMVLMKEYLGIDEEKEEEKKVEEEKKQEISHWRMDKEKAGMVKLSEAFEKMRGLANLGERRVLSNGLWGNVNENLNEGKSDPTKEEMLAFLQKQFGREEGFQNDAEVAIYWFANHYHGGQWSNLYSVLSTSPFRPGPISRGPQEGSGEEMMYKALQSEFSGNPKSYKDSGFSFTSGELDKHRREDSVDEETDVDVRKCVDCGKPILKDHPSDICVACQSNLKKKSIYNRWPDGRNVDEEKRMQDATKPSTKGALHKDLSIPQGKKIPTDRLKSLQAMLHKKSEAGTLNDKELTLSKRINFALNARNENK